MVATAFGRSTPKPEYHSCQMRRRVQGPRRARSVKSYPRHTRIMAILALLAVVGAVLSDITSDRFWERHALLAGLVSSVIVVVLSIAVINEVLERRRRQRWSILAQYVMFELIRNARMIWSGVLEAAGLFWTTANQQESVDAGARLVRDTPGLTAALRGILDGADSRARLRDETRRVGRRYRMDRRPLGLFSPAR